MPFYLSRTERTTLVTDCSVASRWNCLYKFERRYITGTYHLPRIDKRQTSQIYSWPQKMMGNLFSITIKTLQMSYSFNLRAYSAGSSIRDELWGTVFLLTLSTNLLTASDGACVRSTTQTYTYYTYLLYTNNVSTWQ